MARSRKAKPEKDEVREERITMEIVVDAYDEDERAMGWYYYLARQAGRPVPRPVRRGAGRSRRCRWATRSRWSGCRRSDECEREMFVLIRWGKRKLAVPLAQLEVVEADDATREAVEDWHYWVGMGYEF